MNWKREIELCDLSLELDQRNCMRTIPFHCFRSNSQFIVGITEDLLKMYSMSQTTKNCNIQRKKLSKIFPTILLGTREVTFYRKFMRTNLGNLILCLLLVLLCFWNRRLFFIFPVLMNRIRLDSKCFLHFSR
jgi:hypothetical protein